MMEEDFLFRIKGVGLIKSHTLILDEKGDTVITVITAKSGMASVTQFLCKDVPSFEGQESLSEEELKKAGFEDLSTKLYKFSMIDTSRKMTTAESTYSVVTGKDVDSGELTLKKVYTAEKLSALGFLAVFKEGDAPIAKAYTEGMKMTPSLEAAKGVDVLAVILIGFTLTSNDSSAGALAGAGVI